MRGGWRTLRVSVPEKAAHHFETLAADLGMTVNALLAALIRHVLVAETGNVPGAAELRRRAREIEAEAEAKFDAHMEALAAATVQLARRTPRRRGGRRGGLRGPAPVEEILDLCARDDVDAARKYLVTLEPPHVRENVERCLQREHREVWARIEAARDAQKLAPIAAEVDRC